MKYRAVPSGQQLMSVIFERGLGPHDARMPSALHRLLAVIAPLMMTIGMGGVLQLQISEVLA